MYVAVCQVLQVCFSDLDSMAMSMLHLVDLVQQVTTLEQSYLSVTDHKSSCSCRMFIGYCESDMYHIFHMVM